MEIIHNNTINNETLNNESFTYTLDNPTKKSQIYIVHIPIDTCLKISNTNTVFYASNDVYLPIVAKKKKNNSINIIK